MDSRDGEPGMVGRAGNAEVDAASDSRDGDPGKREVEPRTVGKDGNDATSLAASGMSWETTVDHNCGPFCFFA